jgi:hypothetical protein
MSRYVEYGSSVIMSTGNPSFRLSWKAEKIGLQAIVAVASLVPILGGGGGMIYGLVTMGGTNEITAISLDSHFRYLSGVLLAIGLCFASTIVRIETQGERVRLLTVLVVIGGTGRLAALLFAGKPSASMLAALAMELVVTPLLALWQAHLAKRAQCNKPC